MATNILRYATAVDISENRSFFRGISQSGVPRYYISTPLFYYVNVSVRQSTRDIYSEVQQDLRDMDYGGTSTLVSLRAGPDRNVDFTWVDSESAWSGVTVNATGLPNSEVTGMDIPLSGGDINNIAVGDWLQFDYSEPTLSGRYKVYQVSAVDTSARNITLNTGLINPIPHGTTVTVGRNVRFNLLLTETPGATTIPGGYYNRVPGSPLYGWDGQFIFREVLQPTSATRS